MQFTQDLLDVVQRRGWTTVVIVYDEANRLRESSRSIFSSATTRRSYGWSSSVYVARRLW